MNIMAVYLLTCNHATCSYLPVMFAQDMAQFDHLPYYTDFDGVYC